LAAGGTYAATRPSLRCNEGLELRSKKPKSTGPK
jgi:hypothetical protein